MVAKISLGKSLFGALAYNGEKINKEQGKLLGTNKVFDGCSGRMDIRRAMQDFSRYLSPHVRTEKPVMHVSLNPHPDDRLTDMELENIAREYMERMGFGEQPFIIYKHEDIDPSAWMPMAGASATATTSAAARRLPVTWNASTACTLPTAGSTVKTIRSARWMPRRAT